MHNSSVCGWVQLSWATQQAMSSTHPLLENNGASESAGQAVPALSQRPGGQIYLWKV